MDVSVLVTFQPYSAMLQLQKANLEAVESGRAQIPFLKSELRKLCTTKRDMYRCHLKLSLTEFLQRMRFLPSRVTQTC